MIRTLTVAEMKQIQNELNEFTLSNWKEQLNKAHFHTAIVDELGELLGSGRQFKWWKKGNNPDVWNEKIEAIDVLHFHLSVIILGGNDTNNDCILGFNSSENVRTNMFNHDGTLHHEAFARHVKELLTMDTPYAINEFLLSFGMLAEEVSATYVAKAELNFIRQEDGYKDGTYVKVVDGIEDNQRLKGIVENFLDDNTLTLNDVKQNVRDEFFKHGKEEKES
jgi:dimeric dUTPase (all-alpha-NTP-PPase superfamily)